MPALLHILLERDQQQRRGDDAERDVDPENRFPADMGRYQSADHRAQHRRAAEILGVSLKTMHNKLKEYSHAREELDS